jgi:hypothetical protein
MEMYAFFARVAYRNPETAASGMFSQGGCRPQLARIETLGNSALREFAI